MSPSEKKLRIAFVAPWFGEHIGGGAEAECLGLVKAIMEMRPDIDVEVLTTSLKEFAHDWNKNVHAEGLHVENNIRVRRFKAEEFQRHGFGPLNEYRLMPSITSDLKLSSKILSPLTDEEEKFYIKNMVHSENLYRYLKKHRNEYDFFIFMPYMFGTTYKGISIVGHKALIIPCLHDERYAYLKIYREMMQKPSAILFHVDAEKRLANRIYNIQNKRQLLLGEMVETTTPRGSPERFRQKYGINGDFILYAGRKIAGKNVPLLVEYFENFCRNHPEKNLQLVLIGAGDLSYPKEKHPNVHELGFIPVADKFDAYSAATIFCQPSLNESFSIVMMEAWLQGTVNLVASRCEVTKEHCQKSGGGLWFDSQEEFNNAVILLLADTNNRQKLGQKGRDYVLSHFTKAKVINKLGNFLHDLAR